MLEICIASVENLNPEDGCWQNWVTPGRWQSSRRQKKCLARAQSIGTELLLNEAVKRFTNEKSFPVHYGTAPGGKKFFPEIPYYFSWSHAGHAIACALADVPVGIDIQNIRRINLQAAQKFFNPQEMKFLTLGSEKEQKEKFFQYWVYKESYVKMRGLGLAALRRKCFLQPSGTMLEMMDIGNPQLSSFQYWKDLDILPGYRMAVCVSGHQNLQTVYHSFPEDWFEHLSFAAFCNF